MTIASVVLIILGLSLFEGVSSVDNAVINAEVLAGMSRRGRREVRNPFFLPANRFLHLRPAQSGVFSCSTASAIYARKVPYVYQKGVTSAALKSVLCATCQIPVFPSSSNIPPRIV